MTLQPRLDVLPAPQRALWAELARVPRTFVLYGGTALALRFGHRSSVDFDFFAHDPIDHRALELALPFLQTSQTLQEQPNTRTVIVDRDGPVKVSFFGNITFGRVGQPETTDDDVLRVASLLDLAGTKLKALLQRVEAKDYFDVLALLHHGVRLAAVLGAARTLFGPAFNPLVAQKALCYFEGGDLATLDSTARAQLTAEAATDIVPEVFERVSPRLD